MSKPTIEGGLSAAEVRQRVADGRVNTVPAAPVRTLREIVKANAITPVNGIIVTLFVLILVAGYPKDGLFVGVIVANTLIGIAQELKARRELRKLQLLNAPRARVVRDGVVAEIEVGDVVADDVLELAPGDQVVVDGEVLVSAGLEVDESLLTGEADPVHKEPGSGVLSGSFVVAGSGRSRATHVGAASYASTLAEEARRFSLVHSELRRGINLVLRALVAIIPIASIGLLVSLLRDPGQSWQEALQGTVAASVAMVPDGLVLLTSLAFVAGVIALARREALAKELATVELLARVDTLCLDKTGTITTGEIAFGEVVPVGGSSVAELQDALGALGAADPTPNATLAAVAAACPAPEGWTATGSEPFSSARKWAATTFPTHGTYYFGAPDVLLAEADVEARELVDRETAGGRRVLLLSRAEGPIDRSLETDRRAIGVVLLDDTVRPDAPEILRFFVDQGVRLKVISGDNVATVAAVAARAGVPDANLVFDARELPEDPEELADVLEGAVVFGRVTPHQKQAMVRAMQSRGRVVAMTGDGVNDVLALKDSDMGIAMGSGSSASRSVAELVLLDNRFATLPEVLAQGRRVINNVERVANLFVTKAAYAVVLTVLIGLQQAPFPLLPRHLTLVGTFSIGVPGFFLALAGNTDLVRPGFLRRVLRFAVPAGVVTGLVTWGVYNLGRHSVVGELSLMEERTLTTITLLGIGLVVLVVVSRPLRLWKLILAAAMAAAYAVVMAVPVLHDWFELDVPGARSWVLIVGALTVTAPVIAGLGRWVNAGGDPAGSGDNAAGAATRRAPRPPR